MKIDLDEIIITQQQEVGLAAFRKEQEEVESLRDEQFLDFYVKWQFEEGCFPDHHLIRSAFKFV